MTIKFSCVLFSLLILASITFTSFASEEPTLVIQRGHSSDCTAFAFSADGRYLVSASHDRTVKIWDVHAGALLRTLAGHGLSVSSVALSNDERMLASVSWDGVLRLWSFPEGELLHSFIVDIESGLEDVVFSYDGKTVYVKTRSDISRSVSVDTGEVSGSYIPAAEVPQFTKKIGAFDPPAYVRDPWVMRLNQDGSIFAAGYADGSFRLYDYPSLITQIQYLEHDGLEGIANLQFSPDSKYLVMSSYDNSISIWDIEEQYFQQKFDGLAPINTTIPFSSFAWGPNGDYFALTMGRGAGDGWIEIWNARLGQIETTINDLTARAADIGISADGKYMYVVCSTSYKPYELEIREFPSGKLLRKLGNSQHKAVFSPDGKYIVSSDYQTTTIWSVETGEEVRWFESVPDAIEFSADSRNVALGKFMYSIETGDLFKKLEFPIIAVSPDGKLAVGTGLDGLKIISLENGKSLLTLAQGINYPWKVLFSPDGNLLAAADGYNAKIWNTKTGALVKTLEGHFLDIDDFDFSPDGKRLVTSSDDATYRFWDTTTWECLVTILPVDEGQWIAYTEDGTFDDSGSTFNFIRWRTGNDIIESYDLYDKYRQYGLIHDVINGKSEY